MGESHREAPKPCRRHVDDMASDVQGRLSDVADMSSTWNGRVDDIGEGAPNVASDVDDMEREGRRHSLRVTIWH